MMLQGLRNRCRNLTLLTGFAALVVATATLRPSSDGQVLRIVREAASAFHSADAGARLDPIRGELADAASKTPIRHPMALGSGPLFWIRAGLLTTQADRIQIELTPLNGLNTASVVLWVECGGPSRLGVARRHGSLTSLIGSRKTIDDGTVRYAWNLPPEVERVALELPNGALAKFRSLTIEARGRPPPYTTDLLGLELTGLVLLCGVLLMPRAQPSRRATLVWVTTGLAHVGFVAILSRLGHTYDLDSWQIAAQIVLDGGSVYEETARYPYGPVFAYVFAAIAWITDLFALSGAEAFHILTAYVISAFNLMTATLLIRWSGLWTGVVFLFLPFLILLTGWHTQIDQVAILFALASWAASGRALSNGCDQPSFRIVLGGGLLGFSIAVKHIFLPFPALLAICVRFGSYRRRIAYAAVTYAVAALLTLPSLVSQGARTAFLTNAVDYQGMFFGQSLIGSLTAWVAFTESTPSVLGAPWHGQLLKLASLSLVGLVLFTSTRSRLLIAIPLIYLLALLAFLPAMANQYLIYAAGSVSVFWRRAVSWLCTAAATGALAVSYGTKLGLTGVASPSTIEWFLSHRWHGVQLCAVVFLADWALRRRAFESPSAPLGQWEDGSTGARTESGSDSANRADAVAGRGDR